MIVASEEAVVKMTEAEQDFYGELRRAAVRAAARGVDDEMIVSILIARLTKEAVTLAGIKDPKTVADAVGLALAYEQAQ